MLFDIDKNKYEVYGDEYIKGETYVMVCFKSYDKERNIIDSGISLVTGYEFVHSEIIYEKDNELWMMSASQYSDSVRTKKHKVSNTWTYYRVHVTKEFITNMLDFFNKVKHEKYDYMGILGFILFNKDRSDKWFCSELVSNIFKLNSYEFMWCVEPSTTSPGKLGELLGIPNKIKRIDVIKHIFRLV